VSNDPVPLAQCPTLPTANVVSYITGTKYPDQIIVIGGHYDSRTIDNNNTTADAPGANDSGSQSALVMELANILGGRTTGGGTGARLPADLYDRTLFFVTFTSEENGTLGSAALANTNLKNYFPNGQVVAMFNNDIVGGDNMANGPAELQKYRLYASGTPRETGNTDGRADDTSKHRGMMRYINQWGPAYVPDMAMVPELRQDRPGRNSDQTSFQIIGVPAVRFIETIECSPSTPDANTTVPYPPPGYPAVCLSNNTAHQHSPFDLFQFVTPSYTGPDREGGDCEYRVAWRAHPARRRISSVAGQRQRAART
jgi:Zn-dependent M28 family amino/carboxypeptidase